MNNTQDTCTVDDGAGSAGDIDTDNLRTAHNPQAPLSPAPKVSVVIPMYCAEDYVDNLLGWLRSQPLKDIEVICVVDGSPDDTLALVQRHAEQDSRIRWVYQENAGAGAARNAGLDMARGEYLAFLDADDLYDSQFLVKMYETATAYDADLVLCQIEHVDCITGEVISGNGFRVNRVPIGRPFAADSLSSPLTDFFEGPQNKLYRRKVVERTGLRFSETRVSNDSYFALCSIIASQQTLAIEDSLVTVRRYANPQSISANRALHTDDMFVTYQDVYNWLCSQGLENRFEKSYLEAWSNAFHYNATYERNERFIKKAARTLAEEEPWSRMNDEELTDAAYLNTGVPMLKRTLTKHLARRGTRELELQRIDNRLSAVREVVRILNGEYGRLLPERASLPKSVLTYLKRSGLRHYAGMLLGQVRERFRTGS